MNRLIVCTFYDKDGIVDKYVFHLLKSFLKVSSKLVLLVNGGLKEDATRCLSGMHVTVLIRENMGFDSGAYKWFFTENPLKEKWADYDEVLLTNTTYFGPFFLWNNYFDFMNSIETDFWGLSVHPGGTLKNGIHFSRHVQTYFLAVRKSMLLSPSFFDYWANLHLPTCRLEATLNFELTFTDFFASKGFSYTSWLDEQGLCFEHGTNPYNCQRLPELIKKYDFPLLKIKNFRPPNFMALTEILSYLEERRLYDHNLIWDALKRTGTEKAWNLRALDDFVRSHDTIYIYGAGNYGKGVAEYLEKIHGKRGAFVVTRKESVDDGAITFEQLRMKDNDGLVVAIADGEIRAEIISCISKTVPLGPLFI